SWPCAGCARFSRLSGGPARFYSEGSGRRQVRGRACGRRAASTAAKIRLVEFLRLREERHQKYRRGITGYKKNSRAADSISGNISKGKFPCNGGTASTSSFPSGFLCRDAARRYPCESPG